MCNNKFNNKSKNCEDRILYYNSLKYYSELNNWIKTQWILLFKMLLIK